MSIRTSGDLRRERLGVVGLRQKTKELLISASMNRKIGYKGTAAGQEKEALRLKKAVDLLDH